MPVIETFSLAGFAARQFTLPARHRLIVRAGGAELEIHRLDATRMHRIHDGEELTFTSPHDTKWQVGPTPGYATIKIETAD